MRFSTRRAAAFLFAASAAALCGCDQATGTADKQVKSDLAAAHDAMAVKDASTATSEFEKAAKNDDATPEMRTVAKSALARDRLTAAYGLIGQIDALELQLARAVNDATAIAQQIRTGGTAIAAYKNFDPKPITTAISDKIAEAQGSADKRDWVKTGDSTIPTLTAAKQNVSKIEGEIAQLQEQHKNLEAERAKLVTDAAAAAERSENSKGKESVDTFKTGSDLRKQAGEKAIELDKLDVQITRQQAELAVAQGQQKIVEDAIAQMQQNSQARDAGWSQVDKDVATRKAFAAKLLGPKDPQVDTVAEKAEQIDELVKKIADLRGQAESAASDAAKYYDDANKSAQAAQTDLRTRLGDPSVQSKPDVTKALKDLQDAVEPLTYKLQAAAAQRTLGNLYASEAASLNRRALLQETVKTAAASIGGTVPESLNAGDPARDRDAKLALAEDAYKASEGLLGDVIDGQASDELQTAARISRTLTYYNWSLLNKLANKDADAKDHLAKAVTDRDAAAGHQVAIPALPSELGAPPAPSTAPAANG